MLLLNSSRKQFFKFIYLTVFPIVNRFNSIYSKQSAEHFANEWCGDPWRLFNCLNWLWVYFIINIDIFMVTNEYKIANISATPFFRIFFFQRFEI